MNTVAELFAQPSWLARLPKQADALCVAASIERNVSRAEWGHAIRQAQDAGFEVAAGYLSDRLTLSKMSHHTDPHTSRAAAQRVYFSGSAAMHTGMVVKAVREHPGRTSAELARITGLERHEAARRTSDAERAGLIHKGPVRLCSIGERKVVTWWPVPNDGQQECLRGAA